MARPGLTRHPKFLRLARAVGGEAVARGCLEFVWEVAYENGDPFIGDAEDIETSARWTGKPGVFCRALLEAGGTTRCGFIQRSEDRGGYEIHDLWDHAPNYVQRRAAKEMERADRGATTRDLLSAAGKKRAAQAARGKGGKFLALASLRPASDQPEAGTPAPAPALRDQAAEVLAVEPIPPTNLRPSGASKQQTAQGAQSDWEAEETPTPKAKNPRTARTGRLKAIPDAPPDPLHTTLKVALLDAYEQDKGCKYGFDGKGAKAIAILLGLSRDVDQHVKRWRMAMNMAVYPKTSDLNSFAAKWNEFVPKGPPEAGQRLVGRGVEIRGSCAFPGCAEEYVYGLPLCVTHALDCQHDTGIEAWQLGGCRPGETENVASVWIKSKGAHEKAKTQSRTG